MAKIKRIKWGHLATLPIREQIVFLRWAIHTDPSVSRDPEFVRWATEHFAEGESRRQTTGIINEITKGTGHARAS